MLESGAKYSGPLFTSIPSPQEMAQVLEQQKSCDHFKFSKEDSDYENSFICSFYETYSGHGSSKMDVTPENKSVNRTVDGFITPVVGDVGTSKTNLL